MKILIQNSGYHLKNLGDVSMLRSAYMQIRNFYPDAAISIYTTDEVLLEKYCPGAIPIDPSEAAAWSRLKPLPKVCHYLFKAFPFLLKRWIELQINHPNTALQLASLSYSILAPKKLHKVKTLFKRVEDSDIVMATGGGYLTTTFFNHGMNILLTLSLAQHFRKRTFFTGQGIAPFAGKNKFMETVASQVLQKADRISFRENVASSEFVQKYGLQNSCFTFDDANYFDESNLGEIKTVENQIAINVRIASYSGVGEEILSRFRSTLQEIKQEVHCQYAPIPITSFSGDSDVKTLEVINESELFFKNTDIPVESVEELIIRAATSKLMITCSYHAGVYAICNSIPTILLSANPYYDQKTKGLIDAFPDSTIITVDLRASDWQASLKQHALELYKSPANTSGSNNVKAEQYRAIARDFYTSCFNH